MTDGNTAGPFTGKHFLAWMLGAFAVVLAANYVLIQTALTTNSGEVPHGTPPAGMRMMQVTRADVNDPGWTLSMTQSETFVHFTLEGVTGAEIRAQLTRPGPGQIQQALGVEQVAPIIWRAKLDGIPVGQWDIEVTVVDPVTQKTAIRRGRLVLP